MSLVFRKSACAFGQVKTEMYLPESPFFKNSLAGASGLVLMSVPDVRHDTILQNCFKTMGEYSNSGNTTLTH